MLSKTGIHAIRAVIALAELPEGAFGGADSSEGAEASGVALDGKTFFYPNPLASTGKVSTENPYRRANCSTVWVTA